ncbi:DUF3887 domain-containing protein [Leucobacter chromiireducens]|uniref:DUF3887 domain-containing protein n=1 Tax=Leucobacter chromiireducens TaxID=283877 RepID=UPI0019CFFC59|nr:DUF3887 domain-containing protein [Leucobacter chromiireducens]
MPDTPTVQPPRSLSALATEVEDALRGGTDAAMSEAEARAAIRSTDALSHEAHDALTALVVTVRRGGLSWQTIGDALGVSRQAAFKRFGAAAHPPTEGTDTASPTIDLTERTRAVFERLSAGDYEAVRADMTYSCARALTKRKVMGVWNEVVRETGQLESCDELTVRTPDGDSALGKLANRHLISGAVVQTTLRHEAGDWLGRVAYNGAGKITGLLIAPLGSEDLPF